MVLEMRNFQNALFETSLFGGILVSAPKPKFMVKTRTTIWSVWHYAPLYLEWRSHSDQRHI